MWIVTCRNVKIRNLHCTHTQPAEWAQCTGNVFALDMGENITLENCDINGCGAIGVYIFGTTNVTLKNNFIHDNTLWAVEDGGMGMITEKDKRNNNVTFVNNKFEHNGYLNENPEPVCEDGHD
jgi:parallel beta-helix repeat protein